MLLLLLGIIVLHVAVLVLLFVSTIVSVSVPRAAGSGCGASGVVIPAVPFWFGTTWFFADMKPQTSPGRFAGSGKQPLFICFGKVRAVSGIGSNRWTRLAAQASI